MLENCALAEDKGGKLSDDEDIAQRVPEESLVPCSMSASCIQYSCEANSNESITEWALTEDKCRKWIDDEDFDSAHDSSTAAETGSTSSANTKDQNTMAEPVLNCTVPLELGFSGRWLLDRVEGDFDTLMVENGFNWVTRTLVKSFNYGIGMAAHIIEQDGSTLSIEIQHGPHTNTMILDLDADEHETNNEDGARIIVRPRWDGKSLHVAGRTLENGTEIQPTWRYMDGENLVIDTRIS